MGAAEISIRPLEEGDLDEADRIMRLAFGTFLGLPDPMAFMGDGDYVRTRWTAGVTSLAACVDGRLVGSNFVTRWGSVGFFGPLTVDPSRWDQGIARRLLEETLTVFDGWDLTHEGLFTFAQSPKHVALYQSYGFLPRYLTPVLGKAVGAGSPGALLSEWADPEAAIAACAALTNSIYPGFEVSDEIRSVARQKLGDTVLVHDGSELAAFAVCHTGPGTEAGSGTCYVKVGAAAPGRNAGERFARLIGACEAYAARCGAGTLTAGVNSSRRGAYRMLVEDGFRSGLIGVAMHRPDDDAYHHPDAWVIDDWR